MKKTLLLNASYEPLSFLEEHRSLKLCVKSDKVEILSTWENDVIKWGSGQMEYPAVLRLYTQIKRNIFNSTFSRNMVIKRDESRCQYCNLYLTQYQITIDHIIPKSQGGISSFANCVVACQSCNNKKDRKTAAQAGMVLLRKPSVPISGGHYLFIPSNIWHPAWSDYLPNLTQ
jgi:5-methylcytosine-specific restriction endonuclease McrA